MSEMKKTPYAIKVSVRYFNLRDDPKLGQGIVAVRIIPCICHYYQKQLSIPYYKIFINACYWPRQAI